MNSAPCEILIWKLLPVIRKELTCSINKEYRLTQKETANKMGLTPAAVSQYKCSKRAIKIIEDEQINNEIKQSADKIFKEGEVVVGNEICRICQIIQLSAHNILMEVLGDEYHTIRDDLGKCPAFD